MDLWIGAKSGPYGLRRRFGGPVCVPAQRRRELWAFGSSLEKEEYINENILISIKKKKKKEKENGKVK